MICLREKEVWCQYPRFSFSFFFFVALKALWTYLGSVLINLLFLHNPPCKDVSSLRTETLPVLALVLFSSRLVLEQCLAHKGQLNECWCWVNKINPFSSEGLFSCSGMGSETTETMVPEYILPWIFEARQGRVMQKCWICRRSLNVNYATDLFGRPLCASISLFIHEG